MAKKVTPVVYTPEETAGKYRVCAALANLFGIIVSIIFLIIAGKKSKLVKDHCKRRIGFVISMVVMGVILGILGTVFVWTVVAPIICGVLGGIMAICAIIDSIVMLVRGACGRFASKKDTRKFIRDFAFAGDETALRIINTDSRYADIREEYEKSRASAATPENSEAGN